jgi:carbon monoxide dehydrogenase subunit G
MPEFKVERYVEAPPEKVFDRLSDFRRAPETISGIKKVEMLTAGPVGVGTRFKETRVMFSREATETMEVIAFERPTGYTLTCESCGCRYVCTFRVTSKGTGTNVEMRFAAEGLTWFAKVMGFLMRPMTKMCLKAIAKDLDDVKAAIEGGRQPAGV